MWVRDEQRIFSEVIPLAADRLNLTDRSWIDQASRANFIRYLASASKEFSPSERAAIIPLFEPWAARIDGQALLATFASGAPIKRPVSLLQRGKNLIRPIAQQLNDRLRH